MKDNVLDLLIYLFENYMSADDEPRPDRNTLKLELDKAGFAEPDALRVVEFEDQRLPPNRARFCIPGSQEDQTPGPGIQISIAAGAGGAAQRRWRDAKIHHRGLRAHNAAV